MYRVAVRWEKCVYHQADLNKEVYIIQPKCNLFCFHTKEFLFRTSFKTSDMCSFICRSPSFERKITRKMLLQDIFFFVFISLVSFFSRKYFIRPFLFKHRWFTSLLEPDKYMFVGFPAPALEFNFEQFCFHCPRIVFSFLQQLINSLMKMWKRQFETEASYLLRVAKK